MVCVVPSESSSAASGPRTEDLSILCLCRLSLPCSFAILTLEVSPQGGTWLWSWIGFERMSCFHPTSERPPSSEFQLLFSNCPTVFPGQYLVAALGSSFLTFIRCHILVSFFFLSYRGQQAGLAVVGGLSPPACILRFVGLFDHLVLL